MAPSDWIALAQAVLLAAAAWFGWRAYQLSSQEHREQRAEAKKAPLRALLEDIIRGRHSIEQVALPGARYVAPNVPVAGRLATTLRRLGRQR